MKISTLKLISYIIIITLPNIVAAQIFEAEANPTEIVLPTMGTSDRMSINPLTNK